MDENNMYDNYDYKFNNKSNMKEDSEGKII